MTSFEDIIDLPDLKQYLTVRLTGARQRKLLESNFQYIAKRDEYCIDLRDIASMTGVETTIILKLLTLHFEIDTDYRVLCNSTGKTYMLPPRTFGTLCSHIGTKKSHELSVFYDKMMAWFTTYMFMQIAREALSRNGNN